MSKSTRGIRVAGIASLAVSLSMGVAAPAFAVPDFAFDRIGGEDRYETAALVADEYGAKPDAIVANGQPGFYADALASNYLSGAEDAPILLTRIKELPQHTLDQLDQMNATNVTIVGGESVVPAAQEQQLKDAGYTVTRIAGDDRFETNADVLAADGASTGGVGLIATGFNFPDALAAGPFAYNGHSLGLSTKDDVKDVVLDALVADGVKEVLIFGGTDAVGPGVEADLASRGITVKQRFAGADRSETSELAAEWALKNINFTNKHVGVASGYTLGYGADALAGGPLEGKADAPMLITRNVDNPDDVLDYMKAHCSTLETGHLFGGPAAVSVAAEAAMEKAAQCAVPGATVLPELVSAAVTDTNTAAELGPNGTTVTYTFDEAIQTATGGTAPNPALFHVYNQAGLVDSGDSVVSVSGNTVTVFFNAATLDTDAEAAALTVATVDRGAVEDLSGKQNPEGDAPLGTSTGGGTTALPAGVTEAPDLTGVGNFAAVPAGDGGGTDVEFTFDEAASVVNVQGFYLILADGTIYESDSVESDDATTVIMRFSETITRANVVRGVVVQDAVTEFTDNEADGADDNELQAADVNNSGNSDYPDLVSIELREGSTTAGDQVLFTFDENIATVNDASFFQLYTAAAEGVADGDSAAINPSNARQVLVDFAENEINNVVGGSVLEGAVTGTDGNDNRDDEVGVANTGSTTGRTAGRTNGPDLTAVALAKETDAFGNTTGTDATYTFDEAVSAADFTKFSLYLADGTRLPSTACAVANNGTPLDTSDDTNVVCEFATADIAATLGTVDDTAVTAVDGGISNPEGAEFTTGGTGTPAS